MSLVEPKVLQVGHLRGIALIASSHLRMDADKRCCSNFDHGYEVCSILIGNEF